MTATHTTTQAQPLEPRPAVSAATVGQALADRIAPAFDAGPITHVEPIAQHDIIADATTKAVAFGSSDRPLAFIICSAPAYPRLIERTVDRARQAADHLPPSTAGAILHPALSGSMDEVSYAVYPYRRPLGGSRFARRLDPHWYRRRVLRWLRNVAGAARPCTDEQGADAAASLAFIMQCEPMPDAIRRAAEQALHECDSGRWQPRCVVEHNDMWTGNVLKTTAADRAAGNACGLWIIDWGSANPAGYGFFDLLQAQAPFRVARSRLRRELLVHCRAMRCDPAAAGHQLLASLGHLGRHREEFPLDRYVDVASLCWARLRHALHKATH
ncbi:MAG: hypothetical protein WD009_01590 [Phycisphaeraceae bacterium]